MNTANTSKPGFWAQRTLALLDNLQGQLSPEAWKNAQGLIALVTAQADALNRIWPTLSKAQQAQAELVMDQTMRGFGVEL